MEVYSNSLWELEKNLSSGSSCIQVYFFIKTNEKNLLASRNTWINHLSLFIAMAEYNLPDEKTLFHLCDYAFVNQYFGQQ